MTCLFCRASEASCGGRVKTHGRRAWAEVRGNVPGSSVRERWSDTSGNGDCDNCYTRWQRDVRSACTHRRGLRDPCHPGCESPSVRYQCRSPSSESTPRFERRWRRGHEDSSMKWCASRIDHLGYFFLTENRGQAVCLFGIRSVGNAPRFLKRLNVEKP